ncbi:urea carboxylase [Alkalihalobacillus sp. MEB130]|uniref:urea carboxylase n=1 Tax=Alkalihalobacillus sp. MEB130 TaxID=2976704 RepID=UPI0028DF262F|nr:urea carboxylase [Alkalihalobacillus sp. MEB130]MDT8861869.1 urea carboxylase [Alkalihalobacillus sp. MEB130]
MFKKVLIANRGAIAVRIERTLKKIGVASVAVYTEADQDSLHVDYADEAILIGEGPAKDSYLNTDLILKTALETGADAIHPGYGFLSENADFARACREQGIAFIGPTPEQMEIFGLKHSARDIAVKAEVPLLPGTNLISELEEALVEAKLIGYPVILKSTAGGGGIGMRVCDNEEALRQAYEGVRHLAETNFKNGGLFLEKYIAKARHVEVQIFGNAFGEVVTLGERDCSIQRRNQKVVEESPAPNLSNDVRERMFQASKRLAQEVGYRSAGTVEFLYDPETAEFYFLEVNTRLQVEHGVTEEVLEVDLVEWMVKEAAGELQDLTSLIEKPKGHSIQARIYAEDCLQNFRPSAGQIDKVVLSDQARIETWLRDGITVTSLYDPMLAKVIVRGDSRRDAIQKLISALEETRFYGITTNLQYLQALLIEEDFKAGNVWTQLLNGFEPVEHAIEVLDGGVQTTVQDWPGRVGHWDVGVPPCGPMDPVSFRVGNKLLGNDDSASGLELTLKGGTYKFRDEIWFCVTGADMQAQLDEENVPLYKPVLARKGQVLTFGEAKEGMRSYLLVAGGFDMPLTLGSAATFTLGGFGGHGGRALRPGDVLNVNKGAVPKEVQELELCSRPKMTNTWNIGVIPGPHCTEEFLQPDYLTQLTETSWEVHFNSSRTGVRLVGPAPNWTREDGGDAGLHPSNIHDNAYAVGTLDLTGDMPILLGPDGPSLGGFVCPVTTASAEFWKLGQLHPGDKIRFELLTLEDANDIRQKQEENLSAIGTGERKEVRIESILPAKRELTSEYPILVHEEENRRFPMTIRCCGDEYLLVEYGDMELDLKLRFQAQVLMDSIKESGLVPYIDLTPGIRSLQVHIDPTNITVQEACERILELDSALPPLEEIEVPSRIVKLPLSWDDPSTQLATDRYQKNVRPDAPWCPSNLEFIRRINGLHNLDEVKDVVFNANYLVMGLGDVYLGAPVATPMDPRHRLVTTKYNPARTWTPENAVGIGGAYMCVYGMEGPGGYQFVGRTIQMWNKFRSTESFEKGKPWLLRFFDQIQFYPVGADELMQLREDFPRGRFEAEITETTFNLGEYLEFLQSIETETETFRVKQQEAFKAERESWKAQGLAEYISEQETVVESEEEVLPEGVVGVRCSMPGSVWKVLVEPGQFVRKGETLLIEESMKMEFPQHATCDGYVDTIYVKPGEEVHSGQLIVGITEEKEEAVSV